MLKIIKTEQIVQVHQQTMKISYINFNLKQVVTKKKKKNHIFSTIPLSDQASFETHISTKFNPKNMREG